VKDETSAASAYSYPIVQTYLPAFFVFLSLALFSSFIPLYAIKLGANKAQASLFTGIKELSLFFFDLPAGMIMDAIGERRSLILGSLGFALLSIMVGLFGNLPVLGFSLFFFGAAQALWLVAVLSYLRKAASLDRRGRTIASLGGIMRLGRFLGPVAGGLIVQFIGYSYLFLCSGLFFLTAVVLHMIFTVKIGSEEGQPDGKVKRETTTDPFGKMAIRDVIRKQRKVFLTTGVVMLILGVVRKARQIVLPIWGATIGLPVASIGLFLGIASGIEMFMAFPGGLIMDKAGRKWALGLCMVLISGGLMLIPLVGTPPAFFLVTILIGIGNGFGSGINMTLGADLANGSSVGIFLGIWRVLSDMGRVISPLIIGLFAGIAYFTTGILVVSSIGFGGFLYMLFRVRETKKGMPEGG